MKGYIQRLVDRAEGETSAQTIAPAGTNWMYRAFDRPADSFAEAKNPAAGFYRVESTADSKTASPSFDASTVSPAEEQGVIHNHIIESRYSSHKTSPIENSLAADRKEPSVNEQKVIHNYIVPKKNVQSAKSPQPIVQPVETITYISPATREIEHIKTIKQEERHHYSSKDKTLNGDIGEKSAASPLHQVTKPSKKENIDSGKKTNVPKAIIRQDKEKSMYLEPKPVTQLTVFNKNIESQKSIPVLQPPKIRKQTRPVHKEKWTELHIGSIRVEVTQESEKKPVKSESPVYIHTKQPIRQRSIKYTSRYIGLGQM